MANRDWTIAKNDLVYEIENLGFPADLGENIAKQLRSEKAMRRMIAYLHYVKPRKAELIVDEMLAICSDIENWKKKKAVEEANAKYNELLYYGIGGRDDLDFFRGSRYFRGIFVLKNNKKDNRSKSN